MKLLLIYANPSSDSLSFALREAFKRGAARALHSVEAVDLYEDYKTCQFDPILTESEKNGAILDDTKRYQEMITRAEALVLIFPIWWFRAPAILEGWFDKVLTRGFAYRYKSVTKTFGIPIGLLPCKKAVVITPYGAPGWGIRFFYANLPWRRLWRGVLKFCGIRKILHFPCYSAPFVSEKQKQKWLSQAERLAERLK